MNVSFAPFHDDAIDYLESGIGIDFSAGRPFRAPRWFCVTARDDEGEIAGVIACEALSWFEFSFHSVVTDPRCVTRRLLRSVFTALFHNAVRLTAMIEPGNRRAIKNATAMGFVVEGLCRRGIDGRRDGLTFGMLKSDCKMLGGRTGKDRITPRAPDVTRRSLHG